MKKAVLSLLIITIIFAGCKSEWQLNEPVMAGLPKELPKEYTSPKGVKVYSDRMPTALEMQLIDEGISDQLLRSTRDSSKFIPTDYWKTWDKYKTHNEYNVLLMDTDERGINTDTLGCPILLTYAGYAAGTVQGIKIINGKPQAVQAVIIVPKLINEEERCKIIFRNGVANESAHIRTLNDPNVYFAHTGAGDIHPIFP